MADDEATPELVLTHDGVTYRMTLGGFTGLDDMAVAAYCANLKPPLKVPSVAQLLRDWQAPWAFGLAVWRWRVTHGGETGLDADEVVAGFTYTDVTFDGDGDDYPEA